MCEPLKYTFDLSIEKSVFPDDLKIAWVTSIYKGEGSGDESNYRPISVLLCFSRILEHTKFNHLYKYLTENNILPKLFCFQNGNSTDHAVVQLTDQITESLKIKNIQLVYLFTF